MVMSELRRQREMFEQNKKLKFVEKQRRKRDSGDDISDGGTYSIRSDIDEGVGVSMFSADVTTAATWGGSTEQSSTEEDSAVDEDDYAEGEVEVCCLCCWYFINRDLLEDHLSRLEQFYGKGDPLETVELGHSNI